jgi:hypothetical protein
LILPLTIAKPMRTVDGFFASAPDTMVQMFKPPFAFREFVLQTGFVARACADHHHAVDSVHRSAGAGIVKVCIDEAGALTTAAAVLGGGAGNVSGRKSRKPSCLFGLAVRSHSALVDRVDGRDRLYLTSPVSKRSEV